MREVSDATIIPAVRVISEPGDATRYDYYVVRYFDDYIFYTLANTFKYPAKISKWDIDREGIIEELAKEYNCNPCTVQECINYIKEAK